MRPKHPIRPNERCTDAGTWSPLLDLRLWQHRIHYAEAVEKDMTLYFKLKMGKNRIGRPNFKKIHHKIRRDFIYEMFHVEHFIKRRWLSTRGDIRQAHFNIL